ncbi:MAG: hypothetical protein IT377_07970 [Polyangiaceae bacterium]|nr:hypothetical protein [Polyangiaceae bacterium]
MPTPAAPFLGFLLGSLFAWVAADELSRSATLQARTLIVVASFGLLVSAPIAGYFLAFAPDWSYGYLVDSQRLPGAIDTAWVLVDAASVPLGFARAARHVRTKRTGPMMRLMAVPALAAGGLVLAALPRLGVHATYSQFHGDFGTRPVAGSPLGYALLAMTLVLLAGVGITVAWLRRSSRAAQRD